MLPTSATRGHLSPGSLKYNVTMTPGVFVFSTFLALFPDDQTTHKAQAVLHKFATEACDQCARCEAGTDDNKL
ncbi:hypothetical protein HBI56_053670 [Parastagonospora nodorum]|uniref:Uncharacterized protein n=1 Tax=Phaeosphaeria nodorum (strain SN15 / ATCC MYA-4574 / FGSC 10173) TaxID=321614 RepID=A0A7U2ICM1_PHANO|nr:hypothetical protein HBH56_098410 [Parastagonospora nodorum]QRD07374.1 hypothetical protein JI435_424300 [Parastagonospora nodorum SN15]KAH3930187.1 hypothetical protein HBH54_112730 [Parastagonospora nodorum]KAH3938977.1 hypothetical protein HBH53_241940 [Parastagonospora nodorum]KAH3964626.1 hypothetical protein HBH51_159290 [Parastagonospora nodorum]